MCYICIIKIAINTIFTNINNKIMQIYNFTTLESELEALEQMSDLCACVCYSCDTKDEAKMIICDWWAMMN